MRHRFSFLVLFLILLLLFAVACSTEEAPLPTLSPQPATPRLVPNHTSPATPTAAPTNLITTISSSPSALLPVIPTQIKDAAVTASPIPTRLATPIAMDQTENLALAHLAELNRQRTAAEGRLRLSSPTPNPFIPRFEPNLLGDIPVLMYHKIGHPEATWTRSPENFRADMDYLIAHGFYPVNLIDLATGQLDHVPVGRRPVVLTFDDSTVGQFHHLEIGEVDPDCAVGILLAMHKEYGDDWPLRATFFVLLPEDRTYGTLFGQPELGAAKLRALVEFGMEVGSHTMTHPNLREIDEDLVQWELAVAQEQIEVLLPNYEVRSLSLPEGGTPRDNRLLESGYSESAGLAYAYSAVVKVGSGPAPSPFSPDFDPYSIPRIRASQEQLDFWFADVVNSPGRYYVSGGLSP